MMGGPHRRTNHPIRIISPIFPSKMARSFGPFEFHHNEHASSKVLRIRIPHRLQVWAQGLDAAFLCVLKYTFKIEILKNNLFYTCTIHVQDLLQVIPLLSSLMRRWKPGNYTSCIVLMALSVRNLFNLTVRLSYSAWYMP